MSAGLSRTMMALLCHGRSRNPQLASQDHCNRSSRVRSSFFSCSTQSDKFGCSGGVGGGGGAAFLVHLNELVMYSLRWCYRRTEDSEHYDPDVRVTRSDATQVEWLGERAVGS